MQEGGGSERFAYYLDFSGNRQRPRQPRPDSSAGCCRPANGRRNSGRCRATRSGARFRSRSSLPSKRDVDLTWGLYGAGKMMGIALVDHIIITEKSHYSFADNGRLCNKE